MIPHRFKSCLLVFIALFITSFLFIGGPEPHSLRSFSYAWGLGHFICFALWAFIYVFFRQNQPFARVLLEVMVLTFVLGGLVEIIQSYIGRQASWLDIWRNMVGALLGVFVFSEARRAVRVKVLKQIQLVLIAIIFWAVAPLFVYVIDDIIAFRQFPLLSGFETPFEHTRWGDQIVRKIDSTVSYSGDKSLRVELDTQQYSGIGLNGAPSDWSEYSALSLQVFNPAEDSFKLYIRIHDQLHDNNRTDRYQQYFTIKAGWNHLLIPLDQVAAAPISRMFDLTRIGGLWIYAYELSSPRTMYLDDVQLLR